MGAWIALATLATASLAGCGRGPQDDAPTTAGTSWEDENPFGAPTDDAGEQPTSGGAGDEPTGELPTRTLELTLDDFDTGSPSSDSDNVFTADPGQCLDEPEVGRPISCDGNHRAEVYYTFNLPEGDFPGDSAVRDESDSRCSSQLTAYVGGEDTSDYSVDALVPSEDSWNDSDDTEVLCLLVTADPVEGSAFQSASDDAED
ncbi:hypothetical protein CZ771_10820 [Actinomycetales bacterium JB111]|nr:hypothetical protein CZ771_10820 [Actinomycetales bacterium JB111]